MVANGRRVFSRAQDLVVVYCGWRARNCGGHSVKRRRGLERATSRALSQRLRQVLRDQPESGWCSQCMDVRNSSLWVGEIERSRGPTELANELIEPLQRPRPRQVRAFEQGGKVRTLSQHTDRVEEEAGLTLRFGHWIHSREHFARSLPLHWIGARHAGQGLKAGRPVGQAEGQFATARSRFHFAERPHRVGNAQQAVSRAREETIAKLRTRLAEYLRPRRHLEVTFEACNPVRDPSRPAKSNAALGGVHGFADVAGAEARCVELNEARQLGGVPESNQRLCRHRAVVGEPASVLESSGLKALERFIQIRHGRSPPGRGDQQGRRPSAGDGTPVQRGAAWLMERSKGALLR